MLRKCEHCGEEAVDDSENHEVCGACGIVVEGANLEHSGYVPSSNAFFVPFSKYGSKTQQSKKPTLNMKYGMSTLDNLCHAYNIDAACKEEIGSLFKRVYHARRYKNREDAAVIVACCLFLVQRKNKKSIPINNICGELHCSRRHFSYFLSFLKAWLSSNSEHSYSIGESNSASSSQKIKTADDNIPEYVVSLIRIVCDKVEDEEKNKLMKKTTELVKLANSCWLLTGRSPRSVVVACTYLCWKSLHYSRKKTSFPQFSSKFEIHEPIAKLRIAELRALLLKLGQKIPSYSKDYVNEDNLLFHLDTILENSETLRNDLFPDVMAKDAYECTEYSTFRVPPKKRCRKEPKSSVKYEPDMNASDIEISDSEIESYIIPDNMKEMIDLRLSKISSSSLS